MARSLQRICAAITSIILSAPMVMGESFTLFDGDVSGIYSSTHIANYGQGLGGVSPFAPNNGLYLGFEDHREHPGYWGFGQGPLDPPLEFNANDLLPGYPWTRMDLSFWFRSFSWLQRGVLLHWESSGYHRGHVLTQSLEVRLSDGDLHFSFVNLIFDDQLNPQPLVEFTAIQRVTSGSFQYHRLSFDGDRGVLGYNGSQEHLITQMGVDAGSSFMVIDSGHGSVGGAVLGALDELAWGQLPTQKDSELKARVIFPPILNVLEGEASVSAQVEGDQEALSWFWSQSDSQFPRDFDWKPLELGEPFPTTHGYIFIALDIDRANHRAYGGGGLPVVKTVTVDLEETEGL